MESLAALGPLNGHCSGRSYELSGSGRTELLKSWEGYAGCGQ